MSKKLIVMLLSALLAANCMIVCGNAEEFVSVSAYEPMNNSDWEYEKDRSLGVSLGGKWLPRTESGSQLWEFALKSEGKLTIRLAEYEEEAFAGIYLFLLNEDQQVVSEAFVDEPLSENSFIEWELLPGKYYMDLRFWNSAAAYQSVMLSLSFDGEVECIPLG